MSRPGSCLHPYGHRTRVEDCVGIIDINALNIPRGLSDDARPSVDVSREISEGFSATLGVTKTGRVVEGRVEREDDSGVEIRTSDFLSGPVRIEASDILERRPSKNSTMPTGLLDTLQKEEILDLLCYLLASARPLADSAEKTLR